MENMLVWQDFVEPDEGYNVVDAEPRHKDTDPFLDKICIMIWEHNHPGEKFPEIDNKK